MQGGIAKETYFQMLDPENRTASSLASNRTACFRFYDAEERNKVKCQVLGAIFDKCCVRAAHIMQRRWLGGIGTPAYNGLIVSPNYLLPPPLDPIFLATRLKQQMLRP